MKLKIVLLCIVIMIAYLTKAQTNPLPQYLPFSQDFGLTAFNILPGGIAVWNGLSGASVNSQSLAELSAPTGNANIVARTSPTTTGGSYGLSTLSNARIYFQSSGSTSEGVNQLVIGFHTSSANSIRVSYDMEIIEQGSGRSLGSVLQYRAGNTGAWTTVANSAHIYNNVSFNAGDADVNGDVDSYTWFVNGLSAYTDYQLRIAHWRSGSAGSSVGLAYDNIHILPLPNSYTITGGGSYCHGGNGVNVNLSSSQHDVMYQLYLNGTATGEPVEGTGSEISFGPQHNEGSYSVSAFFPGGNQYEMTGAAYVQVQLPPTIASAGADQVLCDQSSATLNANEPVTGVGHWTQLSGSDVDFSDMLSPQTIISNLLPGEYSFRWTIEYGICPSSSDDVTIVVPYPASVSNAGEDILTCGSQTQLSATQPVSGQGKWSKFSGPGDVIFENENNYNSHVSVSTVGSYLFRWTVSNDVCQSNFDEVEVRFNEPPQLLTGTIVEQTKFYGESLDPVQIKATDPGNVASELNMVIHYRFNGGETIPGLPGNLESEIVQSGLAEKEWRIKTGNGENFPDAGTYEIKARLVDGCDAFETVTIQLTILPANAHPIADAFYTGSCFFWSNANSKTATLSLAAVLKNAPGTTGDIRTAKVSFFIREGNHLLPVQGAQQLAVGLINPTDPGTGMASAIVQFNLGSSNVSVLNIAVVISGNYTSNNPSTDKTITVATPVPGGQICGGINLQNLQSQGIIAGATGWVTNAGFFVQYNNSLKNPQGKVEIKVLSFKDRNGVEGNTLRTYLIRSNSITNLSISQNYAQFSGKANLTEIVEGEEQIIEGNCLLQLNLVDGGSIDPLQPDQIGITLSRNKGGAWFSANWNGIASELQNILNGNISITSGLAGKQMNAYDLRKKPGLNVVVYPNPSSGCFQIRLSSEKQEEPIVVTISDLAGRIVQIAEYKAENINFEIGENFKKGAYILWVKRGMDVQRVILVKQ